MKTVAPGGTGRSLAGWWVVVFLLQAQIGWAADGGSWLPPEPEPDRWDWLQLTSGEWLKGRFKSLRDEVVEFDSDQFDDVTIDLEDVARFRIETHCAFRFSGRHVVHGTGEMRDGIVYVDAPGGVVEHPRSRLVALVPGGVRESDYWSIDASLGLSGRMGNTDQVDVTASVRIERETTLNRVSLDYAGTISSLEGRTSANNHRVGAGVDFFITQRFYVIVPFVEAFTDRFQNIDLRITPGAGVGYTLIDRRRLESDVELGFAYQSTTFTSDVSRRKENDVAIVGSVSLDLEITSDVDFDNSYSVQLVATDLDKTNHHLESRLSVDIWGALDFDVTFNWDRIENPVSDKNGVRPQSDDLRISVGFGIDF